MIFAANNPFFGAVCEGDGDVTDTEEAFTLRCEEAAERALREGDRLSLPDRGDRGVLRDGDTPTEPEVVVHEDADGNLTGPRQAAHIGTTGGADRLPLPDCLIGPIGQQCLLLAASYSTATRRLNPQQTATAMPMLRSRPPW